MLLEIPSPRARISGWSMTVLAASCVVSALLLVSVQRRAEPPVANRQSVASFRMTLTEDAAPTAQGGVVYVGRLIRRTMQDGTREDGGGSVTVSGGRTAFAWGSVLSVRGSLDPGFAGRTDFRAYAAPGDISFAGWIRPIYGLRSTIRSIIDARFRRVGREPAALLSALLLGDRSGLASSERYFFSRAGAVFLLALSGMHLAILSALLLRLLEPILGRRYAAGAASVPLLCYVFIAGPKVSLLRAFVMFCVYALMRGAGRRIRALDVLAISFLVIVMLWPRSVDDLSFQLSFLALAGILVVGRWIDGCLTGSVPKLVRLPISASIGAQLATVPVVVADFGTFHPIAFVSGIVLSPLITVYMWGGVALLSSPFGISTLCARLLDSGIVELHRVIVETVEVLSRAPVVYTHATRASIVVVLGAVVCGAAIRGLLRMRR